MAADLIIDATLFDDPATTEVDESEQDVNGLIISHPAGGVVSGTGGYTPFLRQNNSDGTTTGFNTSDADTLADGDTEGLDMEAAWTTSLLIGDLPIVERDGQLYYEIRLDLNEENSGTDSGGDLKIKLELSELQLYYSNQQATLADYTAGTGLVLGTGFTNVYDLDSGGVDRSILLTDGPSGSGNDDYAFYIPVSFFEDADPEDYFTLFAQFGPQPQEGATFEEFRIQNVAEIEGVKFNDEDADGVFDTDEDGLAGFVMYIDANGNGLLDLNERTAESDATGSFTFYGLIAGTYVVREVLSEDDLSAAVKAEPDYDSADYLPPSGYWALTTGDTDGDHVLLIELAGSTLVNATVEVGNHELNPSISITKDASISGECADAGDLITYTITVTNDGDTILDTILLEDSFEGGSYVTLTHSADGDGVLELGEVVRTGDTGNDNLLSPGETWTYTYLRQVTQAQIDTWAGGDGTLDNTARVSAESDATDSTVQDSADASVEVCQDPAISITKDATLTDDCADEVGELVTYTVVVDNTGNVALDNVVVTDSFEGGTAAALVVTGDANTNGTLDEGEVWLSGDTGGDGVMDVDETWTYTYARAVTQEDIDSNGYGNGDLDNLATADADAVNSDTAAATVSDDASVDVCQDPAIDVEKYVRTDVSGVFEDQDDPDGPAASTSSTVDFKVVLTNTGNVTLTNITIFDSVVHTVAGVAGSPVTIDYSAAGLNAFIDLDDDGLLDSGEEWSNFDTDGDGTLDDDGSGNPFELGVDESVTIYYSLTSELGQHENTVEVTASAATTDTPVSDEDDANYYVLASEECVGVRTPGFWSNPKWMTFWNAKGDGWGTAPDEPSQAGSPGFADGELLYKVYLSPSDPDENGSFLENLGSYSTGLLVGDYNMNGITDYDAGDDGILGTSDDIALEDTIFISLEDAIKLINASSKNLGEGKTADGIFMLGRDVVATWLNYLANNQETIGECIGVVNPEDGMNTPREYLDAAIDWLQQFASDENSSVAGNNLVNNYHADTAQAVFQFDARVHPSKTSWQDPFAIGDEPIPFSAAEIHSQLDLYNNTGAIFDGFDTVTGERLYTEYCCDADNPIVLAALAQVI